MKIFGYQRQKFSNITGLLEMEEITFCASPEILRRIAEHLNKGADLIEDQDSTQDHLHLQDEWSGWNSTYPDIIVAKCDKK